MSCSESALLKKLTGKKSIVKNQFYKKARKKSLFCSVAKNIFLITIQLSKEPKLLFGGCMTLLYALNINLNDLIYFRFINHTTKVGWTPLMGAAENNRVKSIEWLFKQGAIVNMAMSTTQWTAMHAAAKNGHYECLKVLMDHGGNKHLEAMHREFGRNLKVEDVTADDKILQLLSKYD